MSKSIIKRVKKFLTKERFLSKEYINKFTIAGFIFFVWIAFFDNHNLLDRYKVGRNLTLMEKERIEYQSMIQSAKKERKDLEKDKEKFAREKYFMHKENEEVFIIEKK